MTTIKFEDVVDIVKVSSCATCSTFIYTIPCSLETDFGDFLLPVGKLAYPLAKIKMIVMDNEKIRIKSRVGRNHLEVKFKIDDDTKLAFNIAISAYVEEKQKITIAL